MIRSCVLNRMNNPKLNLLRYFNNVSTFYTLDLSIFDRLTDNDRNHHTVSEPIKYATVL